MKHLSSYITESDKNVYQMLVDVNNIEELYDTIIAKFYSKKRSAVRFEGLLGEGYKYYYIENINSDIFKEATIYNFKFTITTLWKNYIRANKILLGLSVYKNSDSEEEINVDCIDPKCIRDKKLKQDEVKRKARDPRLRDYANDNASYGKRYYGD